MLIERTNLGKKRVLSCNGATEIKFFICGTNSFTYKCETNAVQSVQPIPSWRKLITNTLLLIFIDCRLHFKNCRRIKFVEQTTSIARSVRSLSPKLIKVKYTLVQALSLCTGRTAHRGSRVIALLFLDYGTRMGEGSASRPGRSLPTGNTRYPLYRRLGGSQGRSGLVQKISPPTWIRSPDRPARSQSLCRLRYPAHPRSVGLCNSPLMLLLCSGI